MRVLTDATIYIANGLLVALYFLWERAPHLLSLTVAAALALTFDRLAQKEAVFAPQRYSTQTGMSSPQRAPRTAQWVTGVAIVLWLAATWNFGPPVPLIGAAMWGFGWALLLLMPQQRWTLLWTMKGYLLLYALAVIGFRLYLWQAAQMTPAQLAEVFGGAASAGNLIAQNTGTFTTMGAWVLWVILPAGYFYLFLQNLMAQPMSLVGPLRGAQDVLATLRTRGE